jgi:predicted SnoaL-like aldol condensation-catalyzing enzyme
MNRKDAAVDFLRRIAANDIREAFRLFTTPAFRHHNVYSKSDRASLIAAMEENAGQFPHKKLDVRHALEDGDLVAVHSKLTLQAGGPVIAVVHLTRFEGDRIAEMWDIGAPVPDPLANELGAF